MAKIEKTNNNVHAIKELEGRGRQALRGKEEAACERLLFMQSPVLTIIGLFITLGAIACYVVGFFSSFLEVDKFWVFTHTVSLYTSIITLFKTHNEFLGVVIALFSVVVPLVKFAVLLLVPVGFKPHTARKILGHAENIGKWAMVDVFVVAIIVVSLKLGAIVDVKVHFGVVYFSISILLTMFLVRYFYWVTERAIKQSENEKNAASTNNT